MRPRSEATPGRRAELAGILFLAVVAFPIGWKWFEGIAPFSTVLGLPYAAQLALATLMGSMIGALAGSDAGRIRRGAIFGAVSTLLFALVLETYLSWRSRVYAIELSLLIATTGAVVVWSWLDLDRWLVSGTGRRVQVSEGHWAAGAIGTACPPPSMVRKMSTGWQGAIRVCTPRRAPQTTSWIALDEPRLPPGTERPIVGMEMLPAHLSPAPKGAGKAPAAPMPGGVLCRRDARTGTPIDIMVYAAEGA